MSNQKTNQPDQPEPKGSKFNIDGSGIVFGYCLFHGYSDILFLDDKGNEFHNHYTSVGNGVQEHIEECYGEFAPCEPPPSLTEEEWDNIFSMEGTL